MKKYLLGTIFCLLTLGCSVDQPPRDTAPHRRVEWSPYAPLTVGPMTLRLSEPEDTANGIFFAEINGPDGKLHPHNGSPLVVQKVVDEIPAAGWVLDVVHKLEPARFRVTWRNPGIHADLRLQMDLEVAERTIGGHAFEGFRYRYRVKGWARPGFEIWEESRWTVGGQPTAVTHVIGSIYGPKLYRPSGEDGIGIWDGPTFPGADDAVHIPAERAIWSANTWAGGRLHSRFGKLDGYDLQVSDTGQALLVTFDDPAAGLVLSGHRGRGDGSALVITDHMLVSPADQTTSWREVLLAQQPLKDVNPVGIGNYWLEVSWAERERVRALTGLRMEAALPMVATGPRFDLAVPLLPELRALGYRWISVGPIWKSSATEGGAHSSMSTWSFEVADEWGGLEALRAFCEAAHAADLKVLAWFPYVHVSYESEWVRNPDHTAIRHGGGERLIPLNLRHPEVRSAVKDSMQKVVDAGLDGLWLDAYHGFALEVYRLEEGARIPQIREALALQRELQNMGLTHFVEAWTPFGISSHGVIGGRLAHYERWPFFGVSMAPYAAGPHGSRAGLNLEEIDYGRFLAMRSSLFVGLHLWPHRTDTEPLGVGGDLATLHQRFAKALAYMYRPVGWLTDFAGMVWEDHNGQRILWSCTEGKVDFPEAVRLVDLKSGEGAALEGDAFKVHKDHVYLIHLR